MSHVISRELREQYRDEGFFFLDGVIGESDLRGLRAVCGDFIAKMDARMSRSPFRTPTHGDRTD